MRMVSRSWREGWEHAQESGILKSCSAFVNTIMTVVWLTNGDGYSHHTHTQLKYSPKEWTSKHRITEGVMTEVQHNGEEASGFHLWPPCQFILGQPSTFKRNKNPPLCHCEKTLFNGCVSSPRGHWSINFPARRKSLTFSHLFYLYQEAATCMDDITLGYFPGKTQKSNEMWTGNFVKVIVATSDTHIDRVGVKQPFKANEDVLMKWEWLLQLVIVIVKPLTVSLYSYHETMDRDGCGQGGAQIQPVGRNRIHYQTLLCNCDSIDISINL